MWEEENSTKNSVTPKKARMASSLKCGNISTLSYKNHWQQSAVKDKRPLLMNKRTVWVIKRSSLFQKQIILLPGLRCKRLKLCNIYSTNRKLSSYFFTFAPLMSSFSAQEIALSTQHSAVRMWVSTIPDCLCEKLLCDSRGCAVNSTQPSAISTQEIQSSISNPWRILEI